jgi:hypothetical protein
MTPLFIVRYRPRGGARKIDTKPMPEQQAGMLALSLNLQGYPAEVLPALAVKVAAAAGGA